MQQIQNLYSKIETAVFPRVKWHSFTLVLITLAALFGLAQPAYAAVDCNASSWSVGTEADLNAAIGCFNAKSAGSYTITLTQDIDLAASSTIINNITVGTALFINGDGFTVDGQDIMDARPFTIAANTVATIQNITITGGNMPTAWGGGILNNNGTLTVINSTISGNVAGDGGGIENWGLTTVINSTVSDNSASNAGGGIDNWQNTLFVYSSTISENSAAVIGSGIYNDNGDLTLGNSIAANNSSGDDCTSTGTITIDSLNILEGGNCKAVPDSDPNLAPLQDNGGPSFTHALLPGSPAIDSGNSSQTTDQRGFTRPQGSADDIGAYELYSCAVLSWEVRNSIELDEAIACFNLQMAPDTYNISIENDIDLTVSSQYISNSSFGVSLIIDGSGFTVDGQDIEGVLPFAVAADTTVTMQNITVTRGKSMPTFGAGGIYNAGALTINNSTIDNNSAWWAGGIENDGSLTINDSIISNNTTMSDEGGGIKNNNILIINSSVISGNATITLGGGIYNSASLEVNNSSISGNMAANIAAGIFNSGTGTVNDSTISSNTSVDAGGGIYNVGEIYLTNSTISGNQSSDSGGIITWGGGSGVLNIASSTISGNTEPGVVNVNDTQVTISNSIIANNGEDCSGVIIDGGHNLIEDSNTACGLINGVNDNIVGVDPILGTLQNNGGATFTHALLAGSPALDVGLSTQTHDQRGILRPQGSGDDIGAVEEVALMLPVNDDFLNAIVIISTPYTDTNNINNEFATLEANEATPSCGGTQTQSVWWAFTPYADGTMEIATAGSDYDTALSVWTGDLHPLVEEACNDDVNFPIDSTSYISMSVSDGADLHVVQGGITYYIRVAGFNAGYGNVSLFVDFIPDAQTLTVNLDGTGAGSVTSDPTGINCGADCTESYSYGTGVLLTSTPATGSTFTGWSGACTGMGSCITLMEVTQNVTATFTINTHLLTVTTDGTGDGSVTSSVAGINCGSDCTEIYDYDTVVTLTKTAVFGSSFTGWSGACTGMGSCVVTMNQARTVTATFDTAQFAIFLPVVIK